MIRLILVDDHTIIRDGIQALLSDVAELEVVGQARNGRELLDMLPHTPADVVMMDLNMPELSGFETMPLLREQFPEVRVLILSMLDHEKYVHQILTAGALGYVLKNAGKEEIVHAIRTVASGRPFLCTEIGLNLLHKAIEAPSSGGPKKPNDLSNRETEVLRLIAEGLTNAEIADKLFTSKRTIETHRQNIIEKTQAKNTAALIKYAMETGLLA
ncbi:response regulator transcription factor [Hymenobacter busanensis]|uniref:Response regulator transcription factor n=1 Tax=Hymenobacter busanensis TaxID=2607656 RepID=A0A7L5A193_9BACT|nr:response regulator transcription factor [Hymenobacter busanensis]KAA9338598.1 response regulator transcription factor [Hymenobacter busanensis]QHJ08973.1 response regulator [Hymenobacter busanensis]